MKRKVKKYARSRPKTRKKKIVRKKSKPRKKLVSRTRNASRRKPSYRRKNRRVTRRRSKRVVSKLSRYSGTRSIQITRQHAIEYVTRKVTPPRELTRDSVEFISDALEKFLIKFSVRNDQLCWFAISVVFYERDEEKEIRGPSEPLDLSVLGRKNDVWDMFQEKFLRDFDLREKYNDVASFLVGFKFGIVVDKKAGPEYGYGKISKKSQRTRNADSV